MPPPSDHKRPFPLLTNRSSFRIAWLVLVACARLAFPCEGEDDSGVQWFPQIPTDGVKNFIPNSSFECGTANWGGYSDDLTASGTGNLDRLEGQVDKSANQPGHASFKIALTPLTLPIHCFDYFQSFAEPVRSVLVANQGWFHVTPGESLTLSAYMRGASAGLAAKLVAKMSGKQILRKTVIVDNQWQRYSFTFRPDDAFLFVAVGLNLSEGRDSGTLWVDRIQLERGDQATEYEPREMVESFAQTEQLGNIFTNVAEGAKFVIRAFNNSGAAQKIRGQLTLTDFFGNKVEERKIALELAPHGAGAVNLKKICRGRKGFFRARWAPLRQTDGLDELPGRSVRCAIIEPVGSVKDSPFGFNHAYPFDFLMTLAHEAGILWWRDWAAAWHAVEPQKGRFDFSVPDWQINRTRRLGGKVEVLLPSPSAPWSTSAREQDIQKYSHRGYSQEELRLSFLPKNMKDFADYAMETVGHYKKEALGNITTYQILNEPYGSMYSLPQACGYSILDYVRFLSNTYPALKQIDPQCRIVGGMGYTVDAKPTLELVAAGALRFMDIFDMHVYESRPAEKMEPAFRALSEAMRRQGGPRELWITEYGCYAEDDPSFLPFKMGDETMNQCLWPDERQATEQIVKFTAISFAYGMRKIFFHAGVCGAINNPNPGSVLFEYGGIPRKMYPGVAALTTLLGVPDRFVKQIDRDDLKGFVFQSNGHAVAIAWAAKGQTAALELQPGVQPYDIMGNKLKGGRLKLNSTPVYLTSNSGETIVRTLSGSK